jgi:hypothetical protein
MQFTGSRLSHRNSSFYLGKLRDLNSGIDLIKLILSLNIFRSDEVIMKSKSLLLRVRQTQSVRAVPLKNRFLSEPPRSGDSPKTIPTLKVPKYRSNGL